MTNNKPCTIKRNEPNVQTLMGNEGQFDCDRDELASDDRLKFQGAAYQEERAKVDHEAK